VENVILLVGEKVHVEITLHETSWGEWEIQALFRLPIEDEGEAEEEAQGLLACFLDASGYDKNNATVFIDRKPLKEKNDKLEDT